MKYKFINCYFFYFKNNYENLLFISLIKYFLNIIFKHLYIKKDKNKNQLKKN